LDLSFRSVVEPIEYRKQEVESVDGRMAVPLWPPKGKARAACGWAR
jgi:hypothetical protein